MVKMQAGQRTTARVTLRMIPDLDPVAGTSLAGKMGSLLVVKVDMLAGYMVMEVVARVDRWQTDVL